MKFIIIGLLCNSQGCYWADADFSKNSAVYNSIEECRAKATDWKSKTAMYFKMDCMVYLPRILL